MSCHVYWLGSGRHDDSDLSHATSPLHPNVSRTEGTDEVFDILLNFSEVLEAVRHSRASEASEAPGAPAVAGAASCGARGFRGSASCGGLRGRLRSAGSSSEAC